MAFAPACVSSSYCSKPSSPATSSTVADWLPSFRTMARSASRSFGSAATVVGRSPTSASRTENVSASISATLPVSGLAVQTKRRVATGASKALSISASGGGGSLAPPAAAPVPPVPGWAIGAPLPFVPPRALALPPAPGSGPRESAEAMSASAELHPPSVVLPVANASTVAAPNQTLQDLWFIVPPLVRPVRTRSACAVSPNRARGT
jgi:hypothetical protein